MNYLSHFVLNHELRRLPREPYFVLGVALPDLWLRFSRRRRIRWKQVREFSPRDPAQAALRHGLLNHAEADRLFHALPLFLSWQRDLKLALGPSDAHPAMVDFLAHVALELALDHRLIERDPGVVDSFYRLVGAVDPQIMEPAVAALAGVDARGLGETVAGFVRRRFIRIYATHRGLCETIFVILELARFPQPPPRVVEQLVAEALVRASPSAVWAAWPAAASSAAPTAAGAWLSPW